jgi:hypothetical protein
MSKGKLIIPREQQNLGNTMNGRDSMILFFQESFGVSPDEMTIDFGKNEEVVKYLEQAKKQ